MKGYNIIYQNKLYEVNKLGILDFLSGIIGGAITPFFIFISAAILIPSCKIGKILSPKKFKRYLTDLPQNSGTTPFSALSVALAGTLGVGNITGVASALISGGPGAVLWMWIGAIIVLAVKYAEVYLAVEYRKKDKKGFYGGAMYYIRDGLSKKIPYRISSVFGGIFALLCIANSLITGNIVQSNSAVCVIPGNYRLLCGLILAFFVLISIIYGTRKIEKITSKLIPPLSLLYMAISLYIIFSNLFLIPDILKKIICSAVSPRAVFGAGVGFSVREAMRFGVMRGIFSNEAGCGTSPTAHATANTKSPVHQGCFGIVEVIFDTIILCSMTAFVLLIADSKYKIIPWRNDCDSAAVTIRSFEALSGNGVYYILMISVVLFAYASIIAQIYYGTIAIKYLTHKKWPQIIYSAVSVLCTVIGSFISSELMWCLADIIIGTMTAANCTVLVFMREKLRSPYDQL